MDLKIPELPEVFSNKECNWIQIIEDMEAEYEESEKLLSTKQAKVREIENELKDNQRQLKKVQSECKHLKEDIQFLTSGNNNLKNECDSVKFDIKFYEAKLVISDEKKKQIEAGHKKLQYYKDLTGIRWDYGSKNLFIKGGVTNKKDYVATFKFPLEEENITEKLWNDIWKSVK